MAQRPDSRHLLRALSGWQVCCVLFAMSACLVFGCGSASDSDRASSFEGGPQPEPPGDGPFGNQVPGDAQGPGLEPPTPTGAAGAGPASGADMGGLLDGGVGVETQDAGVPTGTTVQQGDQGPIEGKASPADPGSALTSPYRDGGVASDWDAVFDEDADAGMP